MFKNFNYLSRIAYIRNVGLRYKIVQMTIRDVRSRRLKMECMKIFSRYL